MLKKIITAAAGLLTLVVSASSLDAVTPTSGLSVATGYKNGFLQTDISEQNPKGTVVGFDHLKVKDISFWQVGLKGRYALPNFFNDCGCDYETSWVSQFYFRGHALFGKAYSGRFKETTSFATDRGHTKRGYERDYDIALGWLYPFSDCFGIGPVVGYNYDKVKIKTGKVDTNGIENPLLRHLRYTSKFKGAYVGVDMLYQWCDFDFFAGYEFHKPTWHGAYKLKGPDVYGIYFSDNRRGFSGWGNVAYFNGWYHLASCFDIGLGFRYENYRTHKANAVPRAGSFAAVGYPDTQFNKVTKGRWHAYSIDIMLATQF